MLKLCESFCSQSVQGKRPLAVEMKERIPGANIDISGVGSDSFGMLFLPGSHLVRVWLALHYLCSSFREGNPLPVKIVSPNAVYGNNEHGLLSVQRLANVNENDNTVVRHLLEVFWNQRSGIQIHSSNPIRLNGTTDN